MYSKKVSKKYFPSKKYSKKIITKKSSSKKLLFIELLKKGEKKVFQKLVYVTMKTEQGLGHMYLQ